MLQTVHKAGQVLHLFSFERPEWGVSEVSRELEFPKSSTSTLMSTLADQGLLQRTSDARYRLGWRVMSMSEILLETTNFRSEARRIMEHLVSCYGELVHLAALESSQVVYVDKMQSHRAVQVSVTGLGFRLAAHCSGVGKVLLADHPWEEVERIIERQGMTAFTPNTITSLEGLKEEIDKVQSQGYAYDLEEAVPELSCVAAPIRGHTGEVVAAISFSVPTYRFELGEDRYRMAIVEGAREISRNLGYLGQRGRGRR